MKHRVVLMMFGLLLSCETEPEIPPSPSIAMAEASGVPIETLQRGRSVYMTDCSRCHVPMLPDDVSKEDWHVVVPGMAWNAGISEADEDAVLAYILAAKATGE